MDIAKENKGEDVLKIVKLPEGHGQNPLSCTLTVKQPSAVEDTLTRLPLFTPTHIHYAGVNLPHRKAKCDKLLLEEELLHILIRAKELMLVETR